MLFLVLLLGLLLVPNSQAAGDPSPGPRIVGGTEVDPPGKYPFMVALVHHGQGAWAGQFCGGSLISPEWVLTAAHCVVGETASTVDLIIGRHDLGSEEGERIPARKIIMHAAYGDLSMANDIALIRLMTPVTYAPVLLPADGSLEAAGTMLTVTGWGNTESVPEWPTELREVQLPVVGDADCLEAYAGYANPPAALMVCAGATGMDSCQGDSGGPLFVAGADGFTQVGVVSSGEGCGLPGFPGKNTSVAAFTSWITGQSGVVVGPPTVSGTKCLGVAATIVGTAGAETINGTAGVDVIAGLGGNDVINGLGGNDRICGGPGNDTISGGPGSDQVQGNAGNDTISGGLGADILKGGAGADTIIGNAGNDKLFGEAGDDNLDGNLGTDTVTGGLGTDTCYGEGKATCELPAPPAGLDFSSGDVHLAVSTSVDAVSSINVGGSGVIADLNVEIEITHTWVGDLRVVLTHVDTGTHVTIIDQPGSPASTFGCSGEDIDATLDDEASTRVEDQCRTTWPAISGSVRPNNPLSAFDGEDLGGTWRLTVSDHATEDAGFLESWSLHFQA